MGKRAKDMSDVIRELREDYVREHVGQIDAIAADLDSPAEVAMLWALCNHSPTVEASGGGCKRIPGSVSEVASVIYLRTVTDPLEIEVWPQFEVKANGARYRLDFALVARMAAAGAGQLVYVDLEVDGHDYHERTKEQAERDKKRDRDLQSIGWHVARFTGSQVYRDPGGVAGEVVGFALGLAWRAAGWES